MNSSELKKRTQPFALQPFRLVAALPKSYARKLLDKPKVEPLLQEANGLCAIMVASRKSSE